MNKKQFDRSRLILLMVIYLFITQGCRKEVLYHTNTVSENRLSITEAKNYFDEYLSKSNYIKLRARPDDQFLFPEPIWDASKIRDLSIGTNAVLTPLYIKGVYVHISSSRMAKYGFLNYLMMYKDKDNRIITEWIELKPTEKWINSKVSMSYEGRILVKDPEGKIKKVYSFGELGQFSKLSQKANMQSSTNGDLISTSDGELICYVSTKFTVKTEEKRCPCRNHTYSQIDECTCEEGKPQKGYNTEVLVQVEVGCNEIPVNDTYEPVDSRGVAVTIVSGPSLGGIGGESSLGPEDYPPLNCNPDPNYVMPATPPPIGTEYALPCSEIKIPVEYIPDVPAPINLTTLLNLNHEESYWLSKNVDFMAAIYEGLDADDYSDEAKTIARIIIDQGVNDLLNVAWDQEFGTIALNHVKNFYSICCPGLLQPINPMVWVSKWSAETTANYAWNRMKHPDWSKAKCLWEATRESIHTALDIAGMVPVFGEVFDLTNGILYAIRGDGLNATLSFAATLPIAGWAANGVKYVRRLDNLKYSVSLIGGKNIISFGSYNSTKFRKILGIAVGDASKQAHHVLPRASDIINHTVIQRATQAATNQGFHIDDVLNGVPVEKWRNQPNHKDYTEKIFQHLESFYREKPNASSEECYRALLTIINKAKLAISNNSSVHLNNLNF